MSCLYLRPLVRDDAYFGMEGHLWVVAFVYVITLCVTWNHIAKMQDHYDDRLLEHAKVLKQLTSIYTREMKGASDGMQSLGQYVDELSEDVLAVTKAYLYRESTFNGILELMKENGWNVTNVNAEESCPVGQ